MEIIKAKLVLLILLTFTILFGAYPSKAQDDSIANLSAVGDEAFEVMRQFYDYDKAAPLEATISEQLDNGDYVREKILFSGLRTRVPAYFSTPKNVSPPYPAVLLLHGVTSSKESWWEENSPMLQLTEQLLASGYAVLSLDAEYHGERKRNNNFESPINLLENELFVQFRDMMIQSVIDNRRGMDYLATRSEIDTSRIGMVGYSMGGVMTFILSAIDPRIDVSVACVSPIITVPYLPTAAQNFAPFIEETPILMLMAERDERNYTEESANQLFNMIGSNTKDLRFFDSGHMLPQKWVNHATDWIFLYLK